jgi:hypothetical protein
VRPPLAVTPAAHAVVRMLGLASVAGLTLQRRAEQEAFAAGRVTPAAWAATYQ